MFVGSGWVFSSLTYEHSWQLEPVLFVLDFVYATVHLVSANLAKKKLMSAKLLCMQINYSWPQTVCW